MWKLLRDRRLAGLKFRRQHSFGRFIVDFYCAAASLVIEVDGPIHDRQVEHDLEREEILKALGLKVMRFKNEDVLKAAGAVLDAIIAATNAPS